MMMPESFNSQLLCQILLAWLKHQIAVLWLRRLRIDPIAYDHVVQQMNTTNYDSMVIIYPKQGGPLPALKLGIIHFVSK